MPDLELSWRRPRDPGRLPGRRRPSAAQGAAAPAGRGRGLHPGNALVLGPVRALAVRWAPSPSWAPAAPWPGRGGSGTLERTLRLPSETGVQHLFLRHPLIVQAFNLYYDGLHFPVLIGCMIWLFVWHRDRYTAASTTLAALTGACLLVQLIPVAPPRMLPGPAWSTRRSVRPVGLRHAGRIRPRPALRHAVRACRLGHPRRDHGDRHRPSRWRWLALAYPVATLLVVVVTANHYWMDGIVAAVLLVIAAAGSRHSGRSPGGGAARRNLRPISDQADVGSSL